MKLIYLINFLSYGALLILGIMYLTKIQFNNVAIVRLLKYKSMIKTTNWIAIALTIIAFYMTAYSFIWFFYPPLFDEFTTTLLVGLTAISVVSVWVVFKIYVKFEEMADADTKTANFNKIGGRRNKTKRPTFFNNDFFHFTNFDFQLNQEITYVSDTCPETSIGIINIRISNDGLSQEVRFNEPINYNEFESLEFYIYGDE